MNTAFWRRWHRWIGLPAAAFLLFASITGLLLAFTEFFGEDEALREARRDLVSPVTTASPDSLVSDAVARAMASARTTANLAPIDRIELQFKGDQPTVSVFTGKPTGGEDRKLVFDLKSGALLRNDEYVDKPVLNRLHSGEWFGDGGLVLAMLWALSLAVLTASGLYIYWTMRGPNPTGLKKIFW
jgi:uncharacterized iron-regulated membrane protein